MVDVVNAFALTLQKFVLMLFQLPLADGLSVGAFMLSVAVLGAVIGFIFSLIKVPGGKWSGEKEQDLLARKALPEHATKPSWHREEI